MLDLKEFNNYCINKFKFIRDGMYIFKLADSSYELDIVDLYSSSYFIIYRIKPKVLNVTCGLLFKVTNLHKFNDNYIICNSNSYNISMTSGFTKMFSFENIELLKLGNAEIITNLPSEFGVSVHEI